MIEKTQEIIDKLDNNILIEKLKLIKEEIKSDPDALALIRKFNEAKEIYEKYDDKETFIKAKENLMKNKIINNYLKLQNEINLLSLYINKKIGNLTVNITCKM